MMTNTTFDPARSPVGRLWTQCGTAAVLLGLSLYLLLAMLTAYPAYAQISFADAFSTDRSTLINRLLDFEIARTWRSLVWAAVAVVTGAVIYSVYFYGRLRSDIAEFRSPRQTRLAATGIGTFIAGVVFVLLANAGLGWIAIFAFIALVLTLAARAFLFALLILGGAVLLVFGRSANMF
jgi:hypothetical protein